MTSDTRWAGDMPEVYDRCLGPVLFEPFAAHVADRAAVLSPRTVLELAAGTGIATRALRDRLPDADITATDLNPAMVAWADAHVENVAWRPADAQQLDFADASFDLVVCQFGVMFFPDKRAAFSETARTLTADGALLFTVWDVAEKSPVPAALTESVVAVFPENPPDFVTRIPHGYADVDAIGADLRAAGLDGNRIEPLVLHGRAPSAAIVAEGFCLGTPLRFALEQRGSLHELTRAVAAEMTARLGDGPVEGELAAFVVTAHKR
ncbi:MAG TPA: class I SAM-dependent methyltransferase [Jatrophihabitans sp.]|nr:class I SAM-dependent methyltransferase [Jatrophihabitans sp.]